MRQGVIRVVGARALLEGLRYLFGRNRCTICGIRHHRKRQPLEFAHLKPTGLNGIGRGQWGRAYDIKNNPNSYALVCRLCHEEFLWDCA